MGLIGLKVWSPLGRPWISGGGSSGKELSGNENPIKTRSGGGDDKGGRSQ